MNLRTTSGIFVAASAAAMLRTLPTQQPDATSHPIRTLSAVTSSAGCGTPADAIRWTCIDLCSSPADAAADIDIDTACLFLSEALPWGESRQDGALIARAALTEFGGAMGLKAV